MIEPARIASELRRLHTRWGVRFLPDGQRAFLRCPFHADGNENTGSLIVNITKRGRFWPGAARCMGCGKFVGDWNKTAVALGLQAEGVASVSDGDEKTFNLFNEHSDKALLQDNESNLPREDSLFPWNENDDWRGIKGKLLCMVGAKMLYDETSNRMQAYLPCMVNGEHVGGVRANLVKQGKRNYFNTEGEWTNSVGLYPYDLTSRRMRRRRKKGKQGGRIVVLVEGPRDALRCQQYGIMAMAILGTSNWSSKKTDLVLALEPDVVILAFDGDEAGAAATKRVYAALKDEVTVRRFRFDEGVDPGNAPKETMKRLRAATMRL